MGDQEKILYFLKVVGPTIPAKVAKNINSEILIASAHLSDLAAQGKVKISSLKIGGTPLYYLPGQDEQLFHFAAGNLNPKDFQVLEILKQQKILRENSIDLLSKVALRSLKDFAVPLQVTVGNVRELFWKWHLLSDTEASENIKAILFNLGNKQAVEQEVEQEVEQQPLPQNLPDSEEEMDQEPAAEYPASSLRVEQEEHTLEYVQEDSEDEDELQEKIEKVLSQKSKTRAKKSSLPKKPRFDHGSFLPTAEQFLARKEIQVQEREIIRKNAEINMVIKVPSVVGAVTYFCKAKKKAKCDEGDVSAAYMEAQIKKLPLLFIYTHELTKKAQEMLATDSFQNTIVQKLEGDD